MDSTAFLLIAMSLIVVSCIPVNQDPAAEYEWPHKCRGKSYCDVEPNYYPRETFKILLDRVVLSSRLGTTQDRFGEDVGSCKRRNYLKKIYLIKDKNNKIRFVPQTDTFNISIGIEECIHPGKITRTEYLDKNKIEKTEVDCFQTMVPLAFPVLSFDGKTLVSERPKDGISLACSAKVMEE